MSQENDRLFREINLTNTHNDLVHIAVAATILVSKMKETIACAPSDMIAKQYDLPPPPWLKEFLRLQELL